MQTIRKAAASASQSASETFLIKDPNRCNSTALRKATRRVSQLYDAALAPSGLRSTQRSILMQIARAGKPTLGELAAALVLDRSALGHNLKPLERDGLVVIEIDPADRRSRLAGLTKKGENRLRQSAELWEAAQHRFERAFGVEKAKALRETLAVISSSEFETVFEGSEAAPAADDTAVKAPKRH
jgi:DNA-binding MarR family transcriptional regulator